MSAQSEDDCSIALASDEDSLFSAQSEEDSLFSVQSEEDSLFSAQSEEDSLFSAQSEEDYPIKSGMLAPSSVGRRENKLRMLAVLCITREEKQQAEANKPTSRRLKD